MEKCKKTYIINSFECDFKAKLRIHSLFNLLQDMADTHADEIGVGYDFCKKSGLGWVGGAYHLKMNQWPKWRDQITIETWPSGTTAACGIRDFQAKNQSGEVILNATSQWVLVDMARMRPVPVAKHLPNYRLVEERALVSAFAKIGTPEGVPTTTYFPVHIDDIDLNEHVNNALYPTWALDGLDDSFLANHRPEEIQISFKRPAKRGDKIAVDTYQNSRETVHIIRNEDGTVEYARVRFVWVADK